MTDAFIKDLRSTLDDGVIVTDPDEMAAFLTDWRGLERGDACCVVLPRTVDDVVKIVRMCAEAKVGIVPQGGNTSMSIGATPFAGSDVLVMNLNRLRAIRSLDASDMTMVAEAGVVLAQAQEAARAEGCRFPLSLASEGSATIGGVISTNAGGNHTLRFGNMRSCVLGIEAVLADGNVISSLRTLRKDNSGYALHQLFTGAEGTLGIVTAAAISLYPEATERQTMLCAVPDAHAALELFQRCRRAFDNNLDACEYMSRSSVALVEEHIEGITDATHSDGDLLLIELAGNDSPDHYREQLETVFTNALEDEIVTDGVLAESVSQRLMLWQLREEHGEAQKRAGLSIKHDVSVPIAQTANLLRRAAELCSTSPSHAVLAPFGHIGDGNIHLNIVQSPGKNEEFERAAPELSCELLDLVKELGGSFSAEHGVGRLKRSEFASWQQKPMISAMRSIKQALDPQWIMNPGVIFEDYENV